jgi:phosphatidate cytidylyltransferase
VIASQDRELWILLAWVTGILVTVSSVTFVLHRVLPEGPVREIADNLALRTKSFWLVFLLFAGALVSGEVLSILLFMGLSLLALREFLTIAPIEPSDHRAMIWTFFVITPLQYFLIGIHWYGFYSVMIPVWAFLFIPTLNAMVGDSHRFLERTATLQWGLMVCVYCVSFAPALLRLRIPGYEGENPKLLLYCVGVVQLSDFLQFLFGKWLGRHPMAPRISPKKSWEGCRGGRADDVGHQARSRREGLRRAAARPRRHAGPDRLGRLLGAGLLPPHALLLREGLVNDPEGADRPARLRGRLPAGSAGISRGTWTSDSTF